MYHIKYSRTQQLIKTFDTQDALVAWLREREVEREAGDKTGELRVPCAGPGLVRIKVYDGSKLLRLDSLRRMGAL